MKPRTQVQRRVVSLRTYLPSLSEEQKQYAYDKCFDRLGFRVRKSEVTCMECAEVFHSTKSKERCPKCGKMLNISDTRKRKSDLKSTFAVVSMEQEFQVIRFFEVNQYLYKNVYARYGIQEIMQHWIDEKHRHTVISGLTDKYGNVSSSLELRDAYRKDYYWYGNRYDILAEVYYPVSRADIRPLYYRNGFRGDLHGVSVMKFFIELMNTPHFETLLKAGQFALARAEANRRLDVSWNAVKIALRNNYIVKDASMWTDYIGALWHLGKDLRNPHYVCPKNLKKAHDYWTKRKAKDIEIKRAEAERLRKIEEMKRNEEIFKLRQRYAGLELKDRNIKLIALVTVEEYKEEGEAMHHCVATYYDEIGSIIFSVVNTKGERIATVELDATTLELLQCRGVCNKDVEERPAITKIIQKNIDTIKATLQQVA